MGRWASPAGAGRRTAGDGRKRRVRVGEETRGGQVVTERWKYLPFGLRCTKRRQGERLFRFCKTRVLLLLHLLLLLLVFLVRGRVRGGRERRRKGGLGLLLIRLADGKGKKGNRGNKAMKVVVIKRSFLIVVSSRLQPRSKPRQDDKKRKK